MSTSIHPIGSIVLVHDPQLAEQLGRTGQWGVVINGRRGGARVLFPHDRATWWIEDRRLYAHPDPSEAPRGLRNLSKALSILDPVEADLDAALPDGSLEVHALATRLAGDAPTRLREALGEDLRGWEVVPYGMAMITVVVRLAARD